MRAQHTPCYLLKISGQLSKRIARPCNPSFLRGGQKFFLSFSSLLSSSLKPYATSFSSSFRCRSDRTCAETRPYSLSPRSSLAEFAKPVNPTTFYFGITKKSRLLDYPLFYSRDFSYFTPICSPTRVTSLKTAIPLPMWSIRGPL